MNFKIEYKGKIVGNNQRYKYRSKKINSMEYETFKHHVGWLCKQQNIGKVAIERNVDVSIIYNSLLDIDNMLKGVFDALEGIAYINDRQIKRLVIEQDKSIDKGFIMTVKPLLISSCESF